MYFIRCPPLQTFARAVIQCQHRLFNVIIRILRNILMLRKIFTQQAVGVLVRAALPRLIRRRKGEPTRDNFPVEHALSARPPEAQARERLGDWEADTVAGVVGGAVLLTLVDRKSRYLRCVRLEKKTADGVNAAMIEALREQTVLSITPDRGKEFARHAVVAEALGIKIYIPPPYQPWQRGTNENTNGLLREYFPKHQDIAQYSDDYLEKAVLALNNRPRKCLQWRTPYEVYFDEALHLV